VTGDAARRIANELHRRGLSAPARLLVEAHLPLAPLLSDTAAALDPLLRLAGVRALTDAAVLAADERGLERLVVELDAVEKRHAEPG
jgi:hypothetical protein